MRWPLLTLVLPLLVAACARPAPPSAPVAPLSSAPAPPSLLAPPGEELPDPDVSSSGDYLFLGVFRRTFDDHESGYAHAFRMYCFTPVAGWGKVMPPGEHCVVTFLPNPGEPWRLPKLARDEPALVAVTHGGMSGSMPMLQAAIPERHAASRLASLGPPEWTLPPPR